MRLLSLFAANCGDFGVLFGIALFGGIYAGQQLARLRRRQRFTASLERWCA